MTPLVDGFVRWAASKDVSRVLLELFCILTDALGTMEYSLDLYAKVGLLSILTFTGVNLRLILVSGS